MPDTSVIAIDASASDTIRYHVGPGNWTVPVIPDMQNKGKSVTLIDAQRIDVLLLGDGFTDRTGFEQALSEWISQFFKLDVYTLFAGAFRIRGLFTRSKVVASKDRDSFYRVALSDDEQVDLGNWPNNSGADNQWFRDQIIASANRFDFNRAAYASNLSGTDNLHNHLANMLSNLVVVMLVKTATGTPSGCTRSVNFSNGHTVNAALGAFSIHEFGHAFAYLQDEYISSRGSSADSSNPSTPSIYNISNLSYSNRIDNIAWFHLSPWGLLPRQAAGNDPSPIVGFAWRGGESDNNVYHSEYTCLMNGSHENYTWSHILPNDPDGRLRNRERFCLWCQEIVCLRILEKTGQLVTASDPGDVNQRGVVWMTNWINHWRLFYIDFFSVRAAINARELTYTPANTHINTNGIDRKLWESDLYQPFTFVPFNSGTAPALTHEETFLMGGL